MRTQLLKMKAEQKVLAEEIRNLKSKRKELKGYVPGLEGSRYNYRVKHIAYCILRGRTLEQIEPKLKDPGNYTNTQARKAAAKIVAEVLNPSPVVEQPIAKPVVPPIQVKESLWTRVLNFLS